MKVDKDAKIIIFRMANGDKLIIEGDFEVFRGQRGDSFDVWFEVPVRRYDFEKGHFVRQELINPAHIISMHDGRKD